MIERVLIVTDSCLSCLRSKLFASIPKSLSLSLLARLLARKRKLKFCKVLRFIQVMWLCATSENAIVSWTGTLCCLLYQHISQRVCWSFSIPFSSTSLENFTLLSFLQVFCQAEFNLAQFSRLNMQFKTAISALSLCISPHFVWTFPSLSPAALEARTKCTDPVLRKEWSAATPEERTAYTNAVLCLATKPSTIGLNTTMYDDFAYVHNKLNQRSKNNDTSFASTNENWTVHGVAQFLPWHRYFMHLHEQALKECGYTGAAM